MRKLPKLLAAHTMAACEISWIEILTTAKENTDAMMNAFVLDTSLEYDQKQLISKFRSVTGPGLG